MQHLQQQAAYASDHHTDKIGMDHPDRCVLREQGIIGGRDRLLARGRVVEHAAHLLDKFYAQGLNGIGHKGSLGKNVGARQHWLTSARSVAVDASGKCAQRKIEQRGIARGPCDELRALELREYRDGLFTWITANGNRSVTASCQQDTFDPLRGLCIRVRQGLANVIAEQLPITRKRHTEAKLIAAPDGLSIKLDRIVER